MAEKEKIEVTKKESKDNWKTNSRDNGDNTCGVYVSKYITNPLLCINDF